MTTSPKPITEFFPPSPSSSQDNDSSKNKEKEESTETPGCHDNSVETSQTTSVVAKEVEQCVSNLLNSSSVFLTPKQSPNKDEDTDTKTEETKLDKPKPRCKKSLSEEIKKDSEQPKTSQKKGRRRKKGGGGTYTPTPKTASFSGTSKSKYARKKSKDIEPKKATQITDYFPVRRSDRRCKTDLEKEKKEDLEYKILNGVEDGLKVEEIQNKGRGVVATKSFKRGDFIVEYAGDLIDIKQAKEREENYSKQKDVGCYMYYFNFKNKQYCIDATAESGKLGRLLNHSKTAGNCHTKQVDIRGKPYLILAASRDISVGEELQYDYGDRSKSSLDSHPWLKC